MRYVVFSLFFIFSGQFVFAQDSKIDEQLPVRGLAIATPSAKNLDTFLQFIEKELAPAHFNLLILRVDYNYAYQSHPELRNENPLKEADVKRIAAVCKRYNIRVVPQINLLGHQSWAEGLENLLKVYPEFDETPDVQMPEKYEWPNKDGLYCKSYCPLHPDVHKIVFALVDELLDAFDTDAFHAGMDEVFYLGDDQCPRCGGRDKAELFAGEVMKIRNHLALKNRRLYIWGDRLIDGKETGIGMWEGSLNQTYRAIDLIPKDVFICDWHYERADLTSVMFAMKGFDVAACPWRTQDLAVTQLNDMLHFRQQSPTAMARHFQGIIQTVWSGADNFLKTYYDPSKQVSEKSDVACIKRMITEFKRIAGQK